MNWAKERREWTEDDWGKVLWLDESTFELWRTKGSVWVWRRRGERLAEKCIVPTVKHGGGKVIVWGTMADQVWGASQWWKAGLTLRPTLK